MTTIEVRLRNPERHEPQKRMVESTAKRLIVKAGRRGGKTVGLSIRVVKRFLAGRRQLYTAPTNEQTDTFWFEVTRALDKPVQAGIFKQNEAERFIELPGTKQRIKAKTAWNANTLRGDYADDLYLDEFQLTAEDAWDEVGAPMLVDNNGDAVIIFTPPSLKSTGVTKAKDPRHASKLFKKAQQDTSGLWETIHFTSLENPFISKQGLAIVAMDMSLDSYRREILAQDDEIEQSWLVYGKFNERVCKIPRFPIPENWLVYVGHDFGSANPAALFLAENPGTGDFYAFKEYAPGGGYSIAQHVDAFQEIITLPNQNGQPKRYNVLRRVGGNRTTEEEIRQGYTAHGWPIVAPKLDRVNAQIDRVIGLMELNKVFIFSDLIELLSQISNCMWVLDEENRPKNKIGNEARFHLLACLRYIASEFVPETIPMQNETPAWQF
jgi:hypothetical protein